MSSKNSKKNDSSFVSYQQERFETEMCNNIEIFEDRSKAILLELDEILEMEKETLKLNDFRNSLIYHFNHFKNEHFSLIEQMKKFNFENEILIEEYHNQGLKISDLERLNDDLRREIKRLKNLEIFNIHMEETLKNKSKRYEESEEQVSQLKEKIVLMKIEIEELNIHNEDLKNQLKIMNNKLEKLKINMVEKDKDFNNFRKSIQDKNFNFGLRNSHTERNKLSLFKFEEKILGFSGKEADYQSLFNNSIVIESELLIEHEGKINPKNAEKGYSIKNLEEMNNDYQGDCKNTKIPFANFVSSNGLEDMTQYNTAVSVTSNAFKKKDDKQKNKNIITINYLKNNLPKNKATKKSNLSFLKIKKEKLNKHSQKISKDHNHPESNQLKNILSLENVLTSFDSEEKIENYIDIKRPKKIEINFNDKNFHENYLDNNRQPNKLNSQKKKSNPTMKLESSNNSSINLRKMLSEGEILNKKDSSSSNVEISFNKNKNRFGILQIVYPINIELLKNEKMKSKNSLVQTEDNTCSCSKINENRFDDPLKEFFLLTFQAVKVNYSEYIEILNMINPEVLYQEIKLMNTPFHMFNKYIFTKFQIEETI